MKIYQTKILKSEKLFTCLLAECLIEEDFSMYGNTYYNSPHAMYRQRVSMQEAMQIALQRIPGRVIHGDMEMENGVLVYEFYILTPQDRIYKVEVDSRTGRIIKIEEENDFD